MQTVFSLLRGLDDTMGHTITTVVLGDDGLYTIGCEVVVDELTPLQRAEYERDMREWPDDYDQQFKFIFIGDAVAYARALQAMGDAISDLQMFNAPSECYSALRSFEADLDAAAAKAV